MTIRLSSIAVGLCAVVALSACSSSETARRDRSRFGYQGEDPEKPRPTEYLPPEPSESAPATNQETARQDQPTTPPPPPSKPSDAGSTPPATAEKKDYPYGTPVPGKSGFVTSPHAPYSGYVDVRGFPPGTEVKDPYTGKIFLVP
jgi:hypothetical protein